ncbi:MULTISPECIES: FeoA family protein [Acidithiobacillus]|uniref:FeoA family protein n=3 Tax=root TaxID=1 RepID=B7J757_ACIF2|nr:MULTISPECIES: FeoA domain-containing protein [Acidithiobacillus]MCL4527014.1 ferrous iron transport protein A [Gammaproteobacteria bacterium]ACH84355.1 FeoA family protein [Acidithiobacillus ferrooxidans ATCC 53993]ACK78890.1 feoA family protein [Acidithiobacillus ferrooxidans ATCC 23270]MBN6743977.1 ferrous iron transport protein A [Acidithiobacillus sp. MC2.2]MBN6746858.1 ferrous iron transport protein A [Acidithiobacillus sp. PG05]
MNSSIISPPEPLFIGDLRPGDHARVLEITGGKIMQQRLGMLGIRRDTLVRVVHGPGKRGAVLQVGGARVALGWGVIQRVRVAIIPTESPHTGEKT